MLIIDGHLDLAWNALQWNRDLRQPVADIRLAEAGQAGPGRGQNTVALPEMRRGRVALCFATLLARSTGTPHPHLDYGSPAQAYAAALGQLAYYRALEDAGHVRIITGLPELERHMAEWRQWDTATPPAAGPTNAPGPPLGLLISMESADPILRPEQLAHWQQAGVRLVGPAHYGPGRYAGGTGSEDGLTADGAALLKEMGRLGVRLDMTHLSDAAFWQALDCYDGPLLASHNNCRSLVPGQRQFSDEQLRTLIARGAVIGAACDSWMLQPGWVRGAPDNTPASLADVADHIDHVCQLASSSRHAAIGSDLDGGFGREQSPHDLDTIADLQQLAPLLAARGYSAQEVEDVMWRNWERTVRKCVGVGGDKAAAWCVSGEG